MNRKEMEKYYRNYYAMTRQEEENLKNMSDEELEKAIKQIKMEEFEDFMSNVYHETNDIDTFLRNETRF